ncbi:Anion exchange protein 3 [Homalodisca vitripennis]|nr:Anion exchange protein 3 [Homalodisca vitripennis]
MVFVQLNEFIGFGEDREWRETARWIKYEENIEEGAERWGKPHVATLSFHSLLNLRRCLETGVVLLDLEEKDLPGISYRVVEQMVTDELILAEDKAGVMRALLLRHRHVESHSDRFRFSMRRNTASYTSLQSLEEERERRAMYQHAVQHLIMQTHLAMEMSGNRDPAQSAQVHPIAAHRVSIPQTHMCAHSSERVEDLTNLQEEIKSKPKMSMTGSSLESKGFHHYPSLLETDSAKANHTALKDTIDELHQALKILLIPLRLYTNHGQLLNKKEKIELAELQKTGALIVTITQDENSTKILRNGLPYLEFLNGLERSIAVQYLKHMSFLNTTTIAEGDVHPPMPSSGSQQTTPYQQHFIHVEMKEETYMSSSEDLSKKAAKESILKRIPEGSEAAAVLVGAVDFLEQPTTAFVRLAEGVLIPTVTEVTIPVRFLFILLGPLDAELDYHEIGRSISTLMSNADFHTVAYKASERRDLLSAINEFLDFSIVLPPGDWEKQALLPFTDIKEKTDEIKRRQSRIHPPTKPPLTPISEKRSKYPDPLKRTRKPFGGLLNDIKRRFPHYISDFLDGINGQCVAAAIFIYFAALSAAITFGGLMADKTGNLIGVSETLVATAGAGVFFSLFSGQPLVIIGTTGPLLLFDESLFSVHSVNKVGGHHTMCHEATACFPP